MQKVQNDDDYPAREWILVEHGRWTRGCKIDNGEKELVIRMIEAEYSSPKKNQM